MSLRGGGAGSWELQLGASPALLLGLPSSPAEGRELSLPGRWSVKHERVHVVLPSLQRTVQVSRLWDARMVLARNLGVLGSKRGSGHCGREESSFLEKPRQLVTCGGTGLCPGHWAPPAPFPAAASPSPTRRGQGGDRGRGHIRPLGKLLIHGATRLTGPWQGLEALV